ncbi:hypothetical protein C8Q74DRAFT_1299769 [Fomes fomentarius]|nr:hypothetical protein C8Q74DRAFT_1299769 [Fomes fomentarius]
MNAGPLLHGLASLDDVFQHITTSNNPTTLNSYLKSFAPKDPRETILSGTLGSGQDPLTILDPSINTLGYLYILCLGFPSLDTIEAFCSSFEPQLARLAPDRVTLLARGIVRAAELAYNPKCAISPLFNLITRYPPHLSYLTTLHSIFLKVCVMTRHFTVALPVLSVPITHIDTWLSDLTYNDNLIYHYAGGIALGALKQWRKAEEFFEICVSAPAQVPAAIQLEAYKKLVLVQLIQYGGVLPLPKYTLPAITRLFKNTSYNNIVRCYPNHISNLRQLVTKEHDLFQHASLFFSIHTERNLGLINQAIDRAPVWLIKKLTATYLTLGLGDIGREVGIDDVERVREIILSMIESGEINANISADGTVTFADPVPQFSKDELDRLLVEAQNTSRELLEVERQVNASKEYLTKAMKHKDDAGWVGPDEDMFPSGLGLSGHGWADDVAFA